MNTNENIKTDYGTKKEKQIEAMTKIIARRSAAFRDRNVAFMTAAKQTASALFHAGYQKPVEGEWIFKFTLDGDDFYECSVCDRQEVINGLCRERNPVEHYPYCHCGAKMKGARYEH